MPLLRDPPQTADLSRTKYPWMVAAYCSFGLALCVILGIAAWGASVDFEEARESKLRSEVNRLRSHGIRTVIRLQELMNVEKSTDGTLNEALLAFLYDQWDRHVPGDPSRLYAGITDDKGKIVAHYRRQLVGKHLRPDWASARVPEIGDDVVETSDPDLTGSDERALDIAIPIMHGTREVGAYHSGFRMSWFEDELAVKRHETTLRWGAAFAVITIVSLLAGVSLFKVAKRLANLQGVVAMEHVRRLADLGTLAGGIAHEVRNPMNAIRLNLHVIKKLITVQGICDAQTQTVMDETISEMERVDGLLRTMLEYARPAVGAVQILDCAAEVRSVANFLSPLLERERIALRMQFAPRRASCGPIEGSFAKWC
ncbi:MAG: histidine kinase dimerization/phospho-acceptor domain-containing protein [Pirellulales bacterium]